MLGTAEVHGRAEPNVEIVKILKACDQFFGVELSTVLLQRGDQYSAVHISFERHVVWRLAGKVFGECSFVIQHQ